MLNAVMPEKSIHHGRNLRRIREILDIKQDTLASFLGEDWNQQKVSYLEQKEVIDPAMLEEVAKALKVPIDAIKNFNEEAAIFNIQNNYEGSNSSATNVGNYHCTFNPIDKLAEALEENKKLYEALLKEKDEKIALLEKFVGQKKGKK
jgi:transcriptional regulator with XRE-family HTH domain